MESNTTWVSKFVIITFILLYALTSSISMIHIVDFFNLSNSYVMSWVLSVSFEIGAAASLAALAILDKLKKELVITIFVILTLLQAMGNVYYSFTNLTLEEIKDWIDLFGLSSMNQIQQRRIISLVSGLPLPIIALGFIKSLVDYLKPSDSIKNNNEDNLNNNEVSTENPVLPPNEKKIDSELNPKSIQKSTYLNNLDSNKILVNTNKKNNTLIVDNPTENYNLNDLVTDVSPTPIENIDVNNQNQVQGNVIELDNNVYDDININEISSKEVSLEELNKQRQAYTEFENEKKKLFKEDKNSITPRVIN